MNTPTDTQGRAAQRIAPVIEQFLGGPPPVRIRMWDGSETGPEDAPTVHVRSRRALRRLLWQPGELGLAEAYISGNIDLADNTGPDTMPAHRGDAGAAPADARRSAGAGR
ncbi:hypothetical protein GCM10010518_32700 [Kitasatospora cinereorecta]